MCFSGEAPFSWRKRNARLSRHIGELDAGRHDGGLASRPPRTLIGVDRDLVGAVLLGELRAGSPEGDDLGFLPRHVAIDAVRVRLHGLFVPGRCMACGTTRRHRHQIALHTVDIVASGTRHPGAVPVALTLLQQPHLVAVDIGRARHRRGPNGRRRRAPPWRHGPVWLDCGWRDVRSAGPWHFRQVMPASNCPALAPSRGVALEALHGDCTIEVHFSIGVARAIDPSAGEGEVGDGQAGREARSSNRDSFARAFPNPASDRSARCESGRDRRQSGRRPRPFRSMRK